MQLPLSDGHLTLPSVICYSANAQTLIAGKDWMIGSLSRHRPLWLLTLLLLFASGIRIGYIVDFLEWLDEIWAVWHVQDSLADVIARTTTDWPPTFGILTWGWMQIAGHHLEVFRWVSVLYGILGVAITYRTTLAFSLLVPKRRAPSHSQCAAVLSALVYSTMGFTIFSTVDARPYALLLALGPLSFWMTMRWLRHPTRPNAIPVTLAISATLYIAFTALPFIGYLTVVVLILKPRLLLQWVGIGIGVMLLTLPLAPQFLANISNRLNTMPQPVGSFFDTIVKAYSEFGGSGWFLIPLVVAALLLVFLVVRLPTERRPVLTLFVWVLVPVVAYFGLNNNEFMKARYVWWVALGLALFIGYAVLYLPRPAQWGVIFLFVLFPLIPLDFNQYRLAVTSSPPYRSVFSWFAQHLRPGDVLVIDPNCQCGERPYGWDYFVRLYLPSGQLPIVNRPGTASRVWYLSTDGWERDEALFAEIQHGRKPSIFVGPWNFLLRLYEGPPSWEGISFGDRVTLNGVEILDTGNIVADNENFQVKLWWSAEHQLDRDYSISLAVLDPQGGLVAQADGPPSAPDTPEQTSAWQPGLYYEDFRRIQLQRGLREGRYNLVVTVYQWWDGERLLPEENRLWGRTGDGDSYLELEELTVLNID
jgi:hypothetical protein